jgi:hypothetical protein
VVDHGTAKEKTNLKQTLGMMSDLIETFPEGEWEPMTGVILIDSLCDLAEKIARRRMNVAQKQRYGDYQGKIGRTMEEERATVRGHIATQIMLGLPLGKPDTKEEARRVGNIGGGNEVFIPLHNPLVHKLIVDPRTSDEIVSWLVVPEGERQFRLDGWMLASDAKQDMYRVSRQREGGASTAYWVPPELLRPVSEWWANKN